MVNIEGINLQGERYEMVSYISRVSSDSRIFCHNVFDNDVVVCTSMNLKHLAMTAILQYCTRMISYMKQLEELAQTKQQSLLYFFKKAGVPTSTYYRSKAETSLRLDTAKKIENAILRYDNNSC